MFPYLSTEDCVTLLLPSTCVRKVGLIKKSVLSICQSVSILKDLFGENIKACMLTGLIDTSEMFYIPQPNCSDDHANTDSRHMFIVEQTGVYALIYQYSNGDEQISLL